MNTLQAQQAFGVLVLLARCTRTAFGVPGGVGLNLVVREDCQILLLQGRQITPADQLLGCDVERSLAQTRNYQLFEFARSTGELQAFSAS